MYYQCCSSKTCEGYIIRDSSVYGARRKRCIPCAKYRKSFILRRLNKPTVLDRWKVKNKNLSGKCKNISRKRSRLIEKVISCNIVTTLLKIPT